MRNSVIFTSPLMALIFLTGCGDDPQEQYLRAQQSFAAHDYNAARIDLTAALKEQPDNAKMLILLAQTQLRQNNVEGAGLTINRLKSLGGHALDIRRLEGEAAVMRGKWDDALALLGEDRSASAEFLRAQIALGQGESIAAQSAFERGLAQGNDLRLSNGYARFKLSNNDLAGAEALIARMRKFAPKSFETLLLSGDILAMRGEFAKALKAYAQTEKQFPKRFEPLIAQADLLDRAGKADEAIKLSERAAEVASGEPAVAALRMRLLAVKGDWAKIREFFQPVEANLDPSSLDGLTYGEALLRLGHAEQARALFARALLLQPSNRYTRKLLAEAELATGDPEGAYKALAPMANGLSITPAELALMERAAREAGMADAAEIKARLQSSDYQQIASLIAAGDGAVALGDWKLAENVYARVLTLGSDSEIQDRLNYVRGKLSAASQ